MQSRRRECRKHGKAGACSAPKRTTACRPERASATSRLVGRFRRGAVLLLAVVHAGNGTCALRALAQQEVERRAVEGLGVLVEPSVREVIEDDQLAPADLALQRRGEARGA